MTLPREVLEAFGLREGGVAVAHLDGELFAIMSPRESIRRARSVVPQWRPGQPLWSEALIEERRGEAASEDERG